MTVAEDTASAPASSAFAPFGYRAFRAVWFASLATNFGGLIQSVGASWMMTSLADSAEMVALVQASIALPIMLLALPAGAIADNLDRRKVMLAAQSFMLLVSAVLAAVTWAGWITAPMLLAFTFLIGIGTAVHQPAWQASVGDLVPRRLLPGAVALNSMGFNLARSVGPAVGGLIVALGGATIAFTVNAVSYCGLIAILARWRPDYKPRLLPREGLAMAMGAGLRFVAMSPNIRVVLLRGALFGLGASAVPAMMPLIARDLIGGGPVTYGLLLGAFGGGAVVGALLGTRLRHRLSTETIARWSSAAFALAATGTALSAELAVTMPVLMLAGAGWLLALSTFNVTVQMASPRWVVARTAALYQMSIFGGMAFGSWGWGVVAFDYDVSTALLASAVVMLLGAASGTHFTLPETVDLNLDPLRAFTEPTTAVAIEARSGPVVIAIEYSIVASDELAFLSAMSERRRIRLRDGARHWTLMRSLQNAELWVERYDTPTWLDYVRHIQRITKADAAISDRILAFHRGDAPPRVTRMIERQTGSLPDRPTGAQDDYEDPLPDAAQSV